MRLQKGTGGSVRWPAEIVGMAEEQGVVPM